MCRYSAAANAKFLAVKRTITVNVCKILACEAAQAWP
jgi:hypothetical protein